MEEVACLVENHRLIIEGDSRYASDRCNAGYRDDLC